MLQYSCAARTSFIADADWFMAARAEEPRFCSATIRWGQNLSWHNSLHAACALRATSMHATPEPPPPARKCHDHHQGKAKRPSLRSAASTDWRTAAAGNEAHMSRKALFTAAETNRYCNPTSPWPLLPPPFATWEWDRRDLPDTPLSPREWAIPCQHNHCRRLLTAVRTDHFSSLCAAEAMI